MSRVCIPISRNAKTASGERLGEWEKHGPGSWGLGVAADLIDLEKRVAELERSGALSGRETVQQPAPKIVGANPATPTERTPERKDTPIRCTVPNECTKPKCQDFSQKNLTLTRREADAIAVAMLSVEAGSDVAAALRGILVRL